MDGRAVTSPGVVKISRLALRLRRSARRGLEPTAGKHVLSCPVLWHLGDLSAKTLRDSRAAPNDLSTKTLSDSCGAPNDLLDVKIIHHNRYVL